MAAALRRACPVCARAADEPFAFLPDVPVHVNVLHATADEARAAPRGDIALAYCSGCGAIWNVLFDPAVMTYDAEYENSLHFSQEFSRFSDELVDRLIDRHDLRDRHVAELGSGKGEFLTTLCDRASCTGVGIDPAYAGESDARANGRVSFVKSPLREDTDLSDADLLICRHVVEHLDDPVATLATMRTALGAGSASIYVEVPAAEYMLDGGSVWDLIYPHVTYLTAPALRAIVERADFHVRDHGYSFGEQYLWVEASTEDAAGPAGAEDGVADGVSRFGARLAAERSGWADRLSGLLAAGPVALWGAGAKGVTFLNVVDGGESVTAVVDVNPRKHGTYVAGTGQLIVPPDELPADLAAVIVMNPIYRDEIESRLRASGLSPEVVVA